MQNKALIVIGMHRSGTSALSGLLDELGFFMGKTLFAAQKGVNEKGFFENAELVALNDSIFDALASSWDNPIAAIDEFTVDNVVSFTDKAERLLKDDYDEHQYWGMKDPRTTLLLPFWNQILNANRKLEPHFLLMVRSPFEVYASLKKRDGFSLDKSLMLWMNYTLCGYFHSKHARRLIVHYNELLSSPELTALKIAELVGKECDMKTLSLSFVDKKMRNQHSDTIPSTPLAIMAQSVYELLCDENVDDVALDKIKEEYCNYQASLSNVLKEHLRSVKEEEVYYRKLFVDAYNSFWWKFSWPIKKVEEFFRGRK